MKNGRFPFIFANNQYYRFDKNLIKLEELKTKSEALFEKVEPYLNVEMDKYNKKVNKSGKKIKNKKTRKKLEMIFWCLIISLCIAFFVYALVNSAPFSLLIVIFLPNIYVMRQIIWCKHDIKRCDEEFERNKKRKLEDVY